jgi:hypothetical protein
MPKYTMYGTKGATFTKITTSQSVGLDGGEVT